MTTPRPIHRGTTYLITRRCTQRQFLLRPDETTERIFLYCLAVAARRFGIRVIAWIALSNHYHAVIEDPEGLLPAFLAHFNKLTAKVLNARWKRSENLWASEQASAVRLVGSEDVLDKTVYTLVNPVAADLVDRLEHWPGTSSLRWLDGRTLRIARPRLFFDPDGDMPLEVTLRAMAPRDWPGGPTAWTAALQRALNQRADAHRKERLAARRRIVGRKEVLRASPFARPSSLARRGGLRPTIACKDPTRRVAELAALRAFRTAYADALARLRDAEEKRGVAFPLGTYKLVQEGLVRTASSPPSATTSDSSALPP